MFPSKPVGGDETGSKLVYWSCLLSTSFSFRFFHLNSQLHRGQSSVDISHLASTEHCCFNYIRKMQTALRKHNCRGITHYQTRCTQKIDPDKYEQGVRYCRRHLDQQGDNDEVSTQTIIRVLLRKNQGSSTDSQGEEQTAVSSGQEGDNVDSVFKTPQTHPPPFLYIGNSTQYTGNPQAADNRPPHRNSTKQPKQREVKPQQPSVSFSVGPDHNGSSRDSVRGSDHGHRERQESDAQRTAQNKRSLNHPLGPGNRSIAAQAPPSQEDDQFKQHFRSQSEVPRVAPQRHQSIGTFQSSRPRHSGSPSQYKQHSVPLYPSYTTKPVASYKPASEPPSTLPSTRNPVSHVESRQKVDLALPSTTYTRNQQSDLTYGTSSGREPRLPLFQQPLSVHAPTNTNNQPTSTQREKRPQTSQGKASQAQALDRTSSTRQAPVLPYGLPTDQFSFDIAGHRQTRVSTAQIEQQVQSFSVPVPFSSHIRITNMFRQYAVVSESWQKFSAGVEDLIGMLRSE